MWLLWRVYIDEAGDRGISAAATTHFVVAAIVVRDDAHRAVRRELAALRRTLGRQPGQVLHFQKFSHSQRLKAVQDLARSPIDAISNVILCKRGFNQPTEAGELAYISNPDPMYLWAIRLLLERVSWYHWPSLEGHRFKIGAPHEFELLQLADTAASALFRAVEPDEFGNTERRYLVELSPKLYRHGSSNVTSYGLKVFPGDACQAGGSLGWLRDL